MSSLSREERYAVERQLASQFVDDEDETSVLDATVVFKLQQGEGDDSDQHQHQDNDSHLVFGEAENSFGSPTSSLTPSSSIASLSSLNVNSNLSSSLDASPNSRVLASSSSLKHKIQTEPRERRIAPRLSISPLESTPIPLEIEEWHYALASIANEKQADDAAALGAISVSAALAQRKAEVLLVKAASERNAAASLRVAHERNIATLLFDSIPQHISAAAASAGSGGGSTRSSAQGNSRNIDSNTHASSATVCGGSSASTVQLPVKRSSLTPAVARAVFLPLCPTAAPEYDPISVKADLAFVKHMTRLGRDDPDAVQRLLRRHLFLCCRLFKGDPWLPSAIASMDKRENSPLDSPKAKTSPRQKLSPVDAALEISRVVGSHSVGSKSAAFRALFRKMYEEAMLQSYSSSSSLTSPPIVPRSTLEAAVSDLNSYAILLARGLLLKYPFLSSLPMVSNPIRLDHSKTPTATAQTPRFTSTPLVPPPAGAGTSSQSPQNRRQPGQRSIPEHSTSNVTSRPQEHQPFVRKSSSFLSLLASTAPSLFGPLPALPPAGGSSGEGGFTSPSSPSQMRRPSSQQVLPQVSLKPVDLGPSLLRCTQEALHILCNDTLFGVVLAHTRLQDEDAAPFLWKMSSQPPCAFGLSHAFCGKNEVGCSKAQTVVDGHLGGLDASTTATAMTNTTTAAEKGDDCYSAAIECLQFLQRQRSPLTKLGALRNCLKAITFSAGTEERLLLSVAAAATTSSSSKSEGDQTGSKQADSTSSIGADDLMPRICFVMARACRRTSAFDSNISGEQPFSSFSSSSSSSSSSLSLRMRPFAELCFLEECMPQEKLLGEDGYTLVSVRGALMHVVMLGKSLP